MSLTGVGGLDRSIGKCNAWLAVDEAFALLPAGLRELLEPAAAEPVTGDTR
jgi:hypothetical protein